MPSIDLFCIASAGGSATAYSAWRPALRSDIRLVGLELPGRGSRFHEPFHTCFTEAVEDLAQQIRDHDQSRPYLLFGHSMGASLAYELACLARQGKLPVPSHLFVSGRRSPSSQRPDRKLHLLGDLELIEELRRLGGTPDEILEDRELLDLFLPIIRADYRMMSTYVPDGGQAACGITALHGSEEDLSASEVALWANHASGEFSQKVFQGGHFFIRDHIRSITGLVHERAF